jgi:nanoRNase/pAp phosphatase (c-di-AMP/oligoRNAs hydrolase)
MDDAKQQLIDKLKTANNVLVTVSRNPSVDQLASCIGLTLLLNKQGKHAAAVFSGEVPSTLEFLQPAETLEKTTDSLRDFIIALDRSKADKLRYKVEDNIVRIFITPYKTSISEADLEFSEGDFNVDLVIALGVHQQENLDEAITAHGRILHDATVASINTMPDSGLGTINWYDPQASSLSELVTDLTQALGADLLDNQIATALLTGIVSETERFSNEKTSSQTMSASAALMAAGANQQLVASKLEEEITSAPLNQSGTDNEGDQTDDKSDDGVLAIDHNNDEPSEPDAQPPASEATGSEPSDTANNNAEPSPSPTTTEPSAGLPPGAKLVTEPPSMGGTLTANSTQEGLDPSTDPLSLPTAEPPQLLDRKPDNFGGQPPAGSPDFPPPSPPSLTDLPALSSSPPSNPPPSQADDDNLTLTELEESVDSPHVKSEDLGEARDEVSQALTGAAAPPVPPEPIQALNAQPLGDDLHPDPLSSPPPPTDLITPTGHPRLDTISALNPGASDSPVPDPTATAPPPVPPPIPFQFGEPPQPQ